MPAPEFDPSKPFSVAKGAPPFDPGKPSTPISEEARPTGDLPWYQRALHGVADPLVGLGQLGVHAMEPITKGVGSLVGKDLSPSKTVDPFVAEREKTYQAERKAAGQTGTDWWRIAGNVASPINYVVPAVGPEAALGRAGLAALSGAVAGASEPVTEVKDDFWSKKAKEAGIGAAVGTVGHAALGALGNVLSPSLSGDSAKLSAQGVQLTPGQMGAGGGMVGRQVRRAEEAFKSFPILGSFIRGGESRSIESFNIATINQALEPIGKKLPQGIKAGYGAVDYAADRLNDAYNSLLPHLTFAPDAQFMADLRAMGPILDVLTVDRQKQFNSLLKTRVADRLSNLGLMDGDTFKQVESEIGHFARQFSRDQDADKQMLGEGLRELHSLMRDALERQNPTLGRELRDINASYAMLTRIEGATGRRLGPGTGVFSPVDLLTSIRSQTPGTRKRAFAHGDALMQDWANTAQRILPGKMPDSGTMERAGYIGGAIGLMEGAKHLGVPGGPETAAAATIAALPYTRVGQAAINAAARNRPLRAIRRGAQKAGPYAGAAAGSAAESPGMSFREVPQDEAIRRAAQQSVPPQP